MSEFQLDLHGQRYERIVLATCELNDFVLEHPEDLLAAAMYENKLAQCEQARDALFAVRSPMVEKKSIIRKLFKK